MKKNKEPKLWVTVLKLLAGAAVLIGGVGAVLWWASQSENSGARVPQSTFAGPERRLATMVQRTKPVRAPQFARDWLVSSVKWSLFAISIEVNPVA